MVVLISCVFWFFFSSRRRYTRCALVRSSDVCSSDLLGVGEGFDNVEGRFEGNGLGVHVLFSSCVNENKLSESHDVSQRKQSTQIGRASCRERGCQYE